MGQKMLFIHLPKFRMTLFTSWQAWLGNRYAHMFSMLAITQSWQMKPRIRMSKQEQLSIVLRYIDHDGEVPSVAEQFLTSFCCGI